LVTDKIDVVKKISHRLPVLSDRDGEYYLRQEGHGLLVGAHERDVHLWAEDETPLNFAHEFFPDNIALIEDDLLNAMEWMPCLADAGIIRVINGSMIWSPDSNV